MQLAVHQSSSMLDLDDAIFTREFNETLVHQLVVSHMAAARQGTHQQKTRAMVRGGGKKPWRQKGTGRARAGSSRGPIWRSGGMTFAKVPRDYSQRVNRKMRQAALQCIFAQLLREERLTVVEDSLLELEQPKVKTFLASLGQLIGQGHSLLITPNTNTNLLLGSRNLPSVQVDQLSELSPVHLVRADRVIITTDALQSLKAGWQS